VKRTKLPTRTRTPRRRKPASKSKVDLISLVQAGVERFILRDAPIGEFRRAVQTATRKGELSSHPLTAAVFRRIVRQAVKRRKRGNGGTV
jgi:hypothetical protein